jgi:hypothetical protein
MWKVRYYFYDVRNLGLRWLDEAHPANSEDRRIGHWVEESFDTAEDAMRAAAECRDDINCSHVSIVEEP